MKPIRATAHATLAGLAALLVVPAAAGADDLIVIPVTGFASGAEGETVRVASVAVPAELVGATCQITGSTVNQVSVHDGNDLLISTNGQTFVVPNFEDAGFIVHEAGETASVGASIDVAIRFGPDGVSSGGFRVSVDCDAEEPPITTTAPPTTAPSTTAPSTTAAPTTAVPTTAPPSTDVDANPPTTAAATTTAPTTAAPTTTVVEEEPPAGPTTAAPTTAAPPTTVAATQPPPEEPPAGPSTEGEGSLPVTGSSTSLFLGVGAGFIAVGASMRRFAGTRPQ